MDLRRADSGQAASQSLQGLITTDGCHRRIVNRARNRIEQDVKDHQEDDQAHPCAWLSTLFVHGKASFVGQTSRCVTHRAGPGEMHSMKTDSAFASLRPHSICSFILAL